MPPRRIELPDPHAPANLPPVSIAPLESTLRNLSRVGRRIDNDDADVHGREVWRFEQDGKPYLLHFYPRGQALLSRVVRGNPALREFQKLQWLQKAQIPAPRP